MKKQMKYSCPSIKVMRMVLKNGVMIDTFSGGDEGNGIVIDPEYIQKYTHIPFSTEQLNLKKSGVRNVDALVMTEASCLVLRYPKAHMRVLTL